MSRGKYVAREGPGHGQRGSLARALWHGPQPIFKIFSLPEIRVDQEKNEVRKCPASIYRSSPSDADVFRLNDRSQGLYLGLTNFNVGASSSCSTRWHHATPHQMAKNLAGLLRSIRGRFLRSRIEGPSSNSGHTKEFSQWLLGWFVNWIWLHSFMPSNCVHPFIFLCWLSTRMLCHLWFLWIARFARFVRPKRCSLTRFKLCTPTLLLLGAVDQICVFARIRLPPFELRQDHLDLSFWSFSTFFAPWP